MLSAAVYGAVADKLPKWDRSKNENPNQGAFILEELTERLEQAVLLEFERMSERGARASAS